MNDFQKEINSYALILYWIYASWCNNCFTFSDTSGEPKFKYEYQKGFPWPHENLVAPFDFAILKSETELAGEKAELLKSVLPYFQNDTTLLQKNLTNFASDIDFSGDSEGQDKAKIYNSLKKNLTEVYNVGILQRSVETYEELKDKTEINKRIGANVSTVSVIQLFSEKTAYNKIHEILSTRQNQIRG